MPDVETDNQARSPQWADALLAARVLAAGGSQLGGVRLRAGAGPVRDAWLDTVRALMPSSSPWLRIPASVSSVQLGGGIDIAATLQTGRTVVQTGLLTKADGGTAILAMAERTEAAIAAIIAQAMDTGQSTSRTGDTHTARFTLIALDESDEGEDPLAHILGDRLALTIDLNAVSIRDIAWRDSDKDLPSCLAISGVRVSRDMEAALATFSIQYPAFSMRKLVMLTHVVRIVAALDGSLSATAAHAAAAIRMCTGLRFEAAETTVDDANQQQGDNEMPPAAETEAKPSDDETSSDRDEESNDTAKQDEADAIMVMAQAASRAALAHLKTFAQGKAGRAAKTGKSGMQKAGSRRGRPGGTIAHPPYPDARPDAVATLFAAIPWQRLRHRDRTGTQPKAKTRLAILPSDFRYIRHRHRTESTAIFAVDASGSTAIARLAEAKGAIELLLAECYVRRDNVALVAFRGTSAETLLEPTRSLVRAKRSLTGLPGGGGTPLANGIMRSLELAAMARRRGQSPLLVYLTDGNANIALDGKADRERARTDAGNLAKQGAALGYRSIFIDIANRPRETARELANAMQADYCPLPHVTAGAVSAIVGRYLQDK